MEKITDKIFTTKKYSIFSALDGNRVVNPLHVKRLVDSMKVKVLFIPIIVNDQFQVIDGQHRLEARKQLGLEIPYIVCPNYTLEDVHRANANHKEWGNLDFLKGYAEAGIEDYMFLLDLYTSLNKEVAISTMLALIEPTEKKFQAAFREGRLKLNKEDRKLYTDLIVNFNKFYKMLKIITTHNKRLILAFRKVYLIEGFDIKRLLEKTEKYADLILVSTSRAQYLYYIDKVYNYRSRDIFKLN